MFSQTYPEVNELFSFWYSTWDAQRILSLNLKNENMRGQNWSIKHKKVLD
jgi:hypothetical protein